MGKKKPVQKSPTNIPVSLPKNEEPSTPPSTNGEPNPSTHSWRARLRQISFPTTANMPKSKPSLQKKPTVTATSVLEPPEIRERKEEERAETQVEEKNVEEEGKRETTEGCDSEKGDDGVTIEAEEALNELAKAQGLMMDDKFQTLLEE